MSHTLSAYYLLSDAVPFVWLSVVMWRFVIQLSKWRLIGGLRLAHT